MDKYQQFAKLMNEEGKADEILSESVEQTRENLKKYGLDFSVEELQEIAKKAEAMSQKDELNAEALDDVAGGVAFATLCAVALASYTISAIAGAGKKWLNSRRK